MKRVCRFLKQPASGAVCLPVIPDGISFAVRDDSGRLFACLFNGPVLVDALVQFPDGLVSVASDSQNSFSSLRVKFGSRLSSVIGGTSSAGQPAILADGD